MDTFNQGYLDSLCGVYSIVNAEKIVNNSSFEDSQRLFNDIISYLSKKRILKQVIIGGMIHRQFSDIMANVVGNRISLQITNKRGFYDLESWWKEAKSFLSERANRTIILSLGGIDGHLTTAYKMTSKNIFLKDSTEGECKLHYSMCEVVGYGINDKHVIYPSQCWYLGKE